MSTSVLTYEAKRDVAGRLADYVELTKPRIAVMELIVVAVSATVASSHMPGVWTVLHALIGTALVAASASAFNQWIERDSDGAMARTADRPLPGGRLSSREVIWFGAATVMAGVGYLAMAVNGLTALLGLATWFMYVVVYTPMKSRSSWNTFVGAIAGAMPVLMGWAAVEGRFGVAAAALFMILFLWQFPHFMAIAWLYRRDYAGAGMKMLSVVDPSGRRAGLQAVVAAVALVPVSILPAHYSFAGPLYLWCVAALSVAQLVLAIVFYRRLDEQSARWLLRASLVYLPSVFLLLLLGFFV